MAFTQNFNSDTFGPIQWKLMGPIADRPATADLHTTYLSTDEGDGVLKAYLYTESGWMQMQGIEGFTGGGGGSGGGGGVMQCVISRDPDTGDYVADKPFADVFSAIYDGETVQIYIDGSPTIQPHAGGSGTAQDPYIIDFYGFSITTNGPQPTQMYVSRYNWAEADGVQWQADGVATLSPAE